MADEAPAVITDEESTSVLVIPLTRGTPDQVSVLINQTKSLRVVQL